MNEQLREKARLTLNEWLDALGIDRAYRKDMKETYKKDIPALDAQLDKAFPIIHKAGFDEAVRKTTDAMNSTFDAQLKEAREQEDTIEYNSALNRHAFGQDREQRLDRPDREKIIAEIDKILESYDPNSPISRGRIMGEVADLALCEKEIREEMYQQLQEVEDSLVERTKEQERQNIGAFLEESKETFYAVYRDSEGEHLYTIAKHAIDKIIKTLKAGQALQTDQQ